MIINKLRDLERESNERGIPIIGRLKGKWLLEKIKEVKPKKILELGTANGYSGIILGNEGAELTTVEINKVLAEETKRNFKMFGIKAEVFAEDGVKFVKKLLLNKKENYFDLIFIDFAKKDYIKVLEECVKLVKKNGLIIADNMSFEECRDYKEAVLKHPKLETEIIEIEDWISCSKKINRKMKAEKMIGID